jgi:hypothetical protein
MLLTPTFVGLLLAGAAFWTLIWAAIHKLDEIPYLKEFTSRKEVLDWWGFRAMVITDSGRS